MKSIIKQEVYKNMYFLAFPNSNREIDAISRYLERYVRIEHKEVRTEDIILEETNKFNRELNKGGQISIKDNTYFIDYKIHSIDGSIIYYVTETTFIDDEPSKSKAEEDLKLRELLKETYELGISKGYRQGKEYMEKEMNKPKSMFVRWLLSKTDNKS